ncbi:MAG: [FeFe] hydrogenase H-cluster radical SAM maturase HydE [Bacilli bacterium]|jgi:biotin synthase|nr:[FeFe] hydrogenase H-cluster radical SAM maturase HydE [Bacilli bacterium]
MIISNYFNKNDNDTNNKLISYFNDLNNGIKLKRDDFLYILDNINDEVFSVLQSLAYQKRKLIYNDSVFIRGLIEISNYCKKDCYYCGIRKSNLTAHRYRYDKNKIYEIVTYAYQRGYRTIVMQGGEDDYYTKELLEEIIGKIRNDYPDVAITLSLGEKDYDTYQALFRAGANRYLLRHESASKKHYEKLHPSFMSFDNRMQCLNDLKKIGYQTGAGLMVGSPFQTNDDLVEDLLFLQEFQPQMIGIGPYLRHHATPFKDMSNGKLEHVLVMYALARLIVPHALLPSTTATSSLDKTGRLKALLSGCNVIMINLSDIDKRKSYTLYENKSYQGDESDEFIELIKKDIEQANMKIDFSIGNYRK